MKKFKEFTAEQKYITEVGPVGALVGALVGGIAAYKGGKALWKKFKGWKENREDKKVRKKEGYDISVPVWNPATNKEELTDFHIDPKEGNKELEGLGFKIPKTLTGKFKAPTDDEKDKWQKEAKRKSQNKTAEMKNKQAKGELNPEKDLTADQQAHQTAAYEPYGRLSQYGQGITGLTGGVAAAQYQQPQQASPMSQALSTALGVGGLYQKMFHPQPLLGKI